MALGLIGAPAPGVVLFCAMRRNRDPMFEPRDGEAFRRAIHCVFVTAAVMASPWLGIWALFGFMAFCVFLRFRVQTFGRQSANLLETLTIIYESDADEWKAFTAKSGRKVVSLMPRIPPLGLALLAQVPLVALMFFGPTSGFVALRIAATLVALAVSWIGALGSRKRTKVVIGADGLRVGSGPFVSFADIERCTSYGPGGGRLSGGVELHRSGQSASTIPVARLETAKRLRALAEDALVRFRKARPLEPPLEPLGYRMAAGVRWTEDLAKASSPERRAEALRRVSLEDPRALALLEETADPEVEEAVRAHLGKT